MARTYVGPRARIPCPLCLKPKAQEKHQRIRTMVNGALMHKYRRYRCNDCKYNFTTYEIQAANIREIKRKMEEFMDSFSLMRAWFEE